MMMMVPVPQVICILGNCNDYSLTKETPSVMSGLCTWLTLLTGVICSLAGIKRSCGCSDVAYHHSYQRRPGQVQKSASHHPHWQRLWQRRRQGSRGNGSVFENKLDFFRLHILCFICDCVNSSKAIYVSGFDLFFQTVASLRTSF